jgi:hypothetical protein
LLNCLCSFFKTKTKKRKTVKKRRFSKKTAGALDEQGRRTEEGKKRGERCQKRGPEMPMQNEKRILRGRFLKGGIRYALPLMLLWKCRSDSRRNATPPPFSPVEIEEFFSPKSKGGEGYGRTEAKQRIQV